MYLYLHKRVKCVMSDRHTVSVMYLDAFTAKVVFNHCCDALIICHRFRQHRENVFADDLGSVLAKVSVYDGVECQNAVSIGFDFRVSLRGGIQCHHLGRGKIQTFALILKSIDRKTALGILRLQCLSDLLTLGLGNKILIQSLNPRDDFLVYVTPLCRKDTLECVIFAVI